MPHTYNIIFFLMNIDILHVPFMGKMSSKTHMGDLIFLIIIVSLFYIVFLISRL